MKKLILILTVFTAASSFADELTLANLVSSKISETSRGSFMVHTYLTPDGKKAHIACPVGEQTWGSLQYGSLSFGAGADQITFVHVDSKECTALAEKINQGIEQGSKPVLIQFESADADNLGKILSVSRGF